MTVQTLAGRCIVVTRPEAQSDSLCREIVARGGEAIKFPVLGIAPASDRSELLWAIEHLDRFDIAFFVSPNAVQHALDAILERRRWADSVAVACVGGGSAQALHARGFPEVIAPLSGFDSEAVLQLPAFSADAIAGRKVLIFRGDGGRDLLGESLRARGAEVEYVTCYRRFQPVLDPAPMLARARDGRLDAITLTSSEGVGNFVRMVGEGGVEALAKVPLFVPHARIAAFARDEGFMDVTETAPGNFGLLKGLEARFPSVRGVG